MERRGTELAWLIALAALLDLAAGVGLAYVAGFSRVRAVLLGDFSWVWLAGLFGALFISFAGYYQAYRGIFRVRGGPEMPGRHLHAVVAAGFGGFLAHGGGALDRYALQAAGAGKADARARVTALGGLEYGVLSLGGCAAAITILAAGLDQPPSDFTIPWAVLPVPGFALGFWAARRYRGRFRGRRGRRGWRGLLGTLLESVDLIRELFVHPRRWALALLGMALFWATDAFAVWAGLAAFGYHMDGAALIVGFATGMVLTRRTAPLGGAGLLALVLPLAIWYSGAPLAVAVVGVFAYRVASLWLPLPVALAFLPTLRTMGDRPRRRQRASYRVS
jgi:undecaprenyl-diphosphatase